MQGIGQICKYSCSSSTARGVARKKAWEKLKVEWATPECRFALTVRDRLLQQTAGGYSLFCVSSVTSQSVVVVLLERFAREGYLKSIVIDNGRQFVSWYIEEFLQGRVIEHCLATLYFPQSKDQISLIVFSRSVYRLQHWSEDLTRRPSWSTSASTEPPPMQQQACLRHICYMK